MTTFLSVSLAFFNVDSLTHALAISAVCAVAGLPELIPFAVLGAVAPDIDVTFQRFSDRDPRLYILTHGGFTHSFAGALIVALSAALVALPVMALAGYGTPLLPAMAATLAGALSHLLLDFLAFPGIPLLYPVTDRKFTLGIAAGPTPYLLFASLVFGVFIVAGRASIAEPWVYGGFFTLVVLLSGALKLYVSARSGGRAIPGFDLVRWLIIAESADAYRVYGYHLLNGRQPATEFPKLAGVSREEISLQMARPEAKRMRYHSYIVTAARNGDGIELIDPLRLHGYLWYPPCYKRLLLPVVKR
ncbi:MAG: inner membrane protein [Methanocella sp. PtaU1.Bin125]|nr:MAG: inner membrane protein [Methanocella sp. PtaU1.Bin125]